MEADQRQTTKVTVFSVHLVRLDSFYHKRFLACLLYDFPATLGSSLRVRATLAEPHATGGVVHIDRQLPGANQ